MAFVVGTNTYISVANADIYFNERLYTESWDAVVLSADKEIALITAFNLLDTSFDWFYDKTESDQIQEFPRNDELVVPQKIINAQCEIVLLLLRNGADLVKPDKEMKLDVISIKTDKVSIFSDIVLNFVKDYGREKNLESQKQVNIVNVLR
jgi:hypothetical protein